MNPEIRSLFVLPGAPVHLRLVGLLADPVRVIVHPDLRLEAFAEPRGPEPSVDERGREAR